MRGNYDERAGLPASDLMPPCRACELEMVAGARDVVHGACWAMVIYDCCGGQWVDYLVCARHFEEIVSQRLPAACERCGQTSRSIADIVDWAMSIGGDITFER